MRIFTIQQQKFTFKLKDFLPELKDFLPKLKDFVLNSRIREIHLVATKKNRWKNKPELLAYKIQNFTQNCQPLKTSPFFPLLFRSLSDECGKWELSDTLKSQLVEGATTSEGGEDKESKDSPRGFVQPFSADADRQWPSVAYLLNIRNKTTCTVTIIAPNFLLTSFSCMATK